MRVMTGRGPAIRRVAVFAAACAILLTATAVLLSPAPRSDEDVIREQLPTYPLKTCVVGGEELGRMGEPVNHVQEGRLVRFCCTNCLKEFRKDPAKYLAKIDEAARGVRQGGVVAAASPPGPSKPSAAVGPKKTQKKLWYCPMHPAYTSDRPADCPICNMKMEPLEGDASAERSGVPEHAIVRIPPMAQSLIGVKWGTAEKRPVKKTIRAAGRVDLNERGIHVVNLRVGGWVERLLVSATGDAVRRGDPLFEMYSPDVLEARRNYLLAVAAAQALRSDASEEARAAVQGTLAAARDRLLLWGLAEDDLRALDPKSPPPARVIVRAPADGVVMRRNIVQGGAVEVGRDLYEIADLATVWVHADVFEYELPDVKPGMDAAIRLSALPGEAVTGKVAYVYPTLNEGTRTARVRVEVPNPDGRLKPGMYAQVSIAVDLGTQVVVDEEAVFDTGLRQIVFVGGPENRFIPREVTLGTRSDGLAVVLRGLEGGERVVTSANFLVDSESRMKAELLRSAAAGGLAPAGPGHEEHRH